MSTDSSNVVYGVMIEVDNLFFGGVRLASEIMQTKVEALGAKNVDSFIFLRKAYGNTYLNGLTRILPDANYDTLVDVAQEINASHIAMMQQKIKLTEEIKNLIRNLLAEGIKVGIVTRLPDMTARDLFAAFVDDEKCFIVNDISLTAGIVPYETWRRGAQRNALLPRNTFAICASGMAMRGALCTGMHAVVRLDALLKYEDCSGANLLVEKFDKNMPAKIANALKKL